MSKPESCNRQQQGSGLHKKIAHRTLPTHIGQKHILRLHQIRKSEGAQETGKVRHKHPDLRQAQQHKRHRQMDTSGNYPNQPIPEQPRLP